MFRKDTGPFLHLGVRKPMNTDAGAAFAFASLQ
jgi:hypothetical protein